MPRLKSYTQNNARKPQGTVKSKSTPDFASEVEVSPDGVVAWAQSHPQSNSTHLAGMVNSDKALILLHEYMQNTMNFLGIEQNLLHLVDPKLLTKVTFTTETESVNLPKEMLLYVTAFLRMTKPSSPLATKASSIAETFDKGFVERLAKVMIFKKNLIKSKCSRVCLLLSLGADIETIEPALQLLRSKESVKNLVTFTVKEQDSLFRYIKLNGIEMR